MTKIFQLGAYRRDTNELTRFTRDQQLGLRLSRVEWLVYNRLMRPLWRRFYRPRLLDAADAADPLLYVAQPLEPAHVASCKVFASRDAMVASFRPGAVWCEVGTYEGEFARSVRDLCPPAELHLIDLTFEYLHRRGLVAADEVVRLHQGYSDATLRTFPDASFDYIYLDAGSDVESVARDAAAAVPKLRPDGVLLMRNYMTLSPADITPVGCLVVANALCNEQGFEMIGLALQYKMCCDVALRRAAPAP